MKTPKFVGELLKIFLLRNCSPLYNVSSVNHNIITSQISLHYFKFIVQWKLNRYSRTIQGY